MAAATADLDTVFQAIVDGALRVVDNADGAVVELREGEELVYHAVSGALSAHRGIRLPMDRTLSGRSIRQERPFLVPDTEVDASLDREIVARLGIRSMIVVPVTRRGQAVGALKLQSGRPDVFSPRDVVMAQMLAGLAASGFGDVAEVRSKRALRDAENRYRRTFESVTEFGVIVTDLDCTVTEWNTGAERIFGWPAAEMVGQHAGTFFTPEDRRAGRVKVEMRQALRDGQAVDERWHLRKDGSRFYASGNMMPLRDDDGTHLGFIKIVRDRTEQHLAGKRLEESETQLRQAQEAGGVGLFTVDVASGLLTATPEFSRLYGLQHLEARPAEDFERLVVAEDQQLVSNNSTRRAGGAPKDVEYRIRRADTGELRWIARKGEFRLDDAGRPARFVGVAHDVTESRTAEDRLQVIEDRFRTIVETIEDAFAIVEVKFDADDRPVDYRFVEANPAFERQAGVNLRGKWVTEFAPDLEQFWFETYGRVARTGEPTTFESYAEAFKRWFDVRAVRVGDPADRQIAIFFSDVTARREAAERLRVSEASARENAERVQLALGAGAIIGTWVWDLRADRFTVDEAFANSFGLDPALGREGIPLAQIVATVHPDDQTGLAAAIEAAIQRGGAYAHQYRVRRADGNFYWLEANGRVEHGADGTPLRFPGVLLDVEERRTVEAERARVTLELRELNETLEQRVAERSTELMQAEEALRQSQKMEAVGQLTGGLAHDFNNLLAGIQGSLEMMQSRIRQGRIADIERYMDGAQGATKRAAALTHRLLAFSRRQTLEPKPTDVPRLVAGMEDLIRRTVGPQIAVETHAEPGLWSTLVDPNQLENALLNLCINSRDALPDGGHIVIESSNRTVDVRAGAQRDMPPGDYVSLSVSDNGVGMPPEVVERVFEPFFTTKPIGVGTGLGLSMTFGFARQSGGQVRVHSEVGRGTTVTILLPRHDATVSDAVPSETTAEAAPSQAGRTVLVIDDEPLVRMLVVDVLEDLGCTAIEAGDGPQGMNILRSGATVDLLITDVGLPNGMNGRQVADAARELRPDLKVLFVTGYAENAVLSHGHLDPGMQVITKPFTIEAMATRVREMVAS